MQSFGKQLTVGMPSEHCGKGIQMLVSIATDTYLLHNPEDRHHHHRGIAPRHDRSDALGSFPWGVLDQKNAHRSESTPWIKFLFYFFCSIPRISMGLLDEPPALLSTGTSLINYLFLCLFIYLILTLVSRLLPPLLTRK